MRNFGIVVICVGLGMMVAGFHPDVSESYTLPLFYVGGWVSFIGCLISLIGSIQPRKQK